jgi:hypothetical protein
MAQSTDDDVVQAIARDTNTPTETVSQMYSQTWAEYARDARIFDFMTILVSRRVRENLSSMSKHEH